MELNQLLEQGFGIAVAFWLLTRTEKKLDALCQSIDQLAQSLIPWQQPHPKNVTHEKGDEIND